MTFRSLLRRSLLLLLLPAAVAQAPSPTIGIGTWNLEFLGATGNYRQDLPLRDGDDFAKIGAYVRELGVAVLAVQEICGEPPLRKVATGAGPTWDLVLGTTGGWDDGITAQNIGFLFDTARVELLWSEELLDFPRTLDGVPIFHRVPVTACFRDKATGTDFRAVTVHLKAGQKPDDLKKRKLEATVLRDWLVLLQNGTSEDQDIVVLGDFNSTYGTDPQQVLEGAGAVRYLRTAEPTPTILHFPEPIDQIAPSPRFGEVDAASFRVHGPLPTDDRAAWRKTYSDHFPVTVALRATGDDDPKAAFSRANAGNVLPVSQRAGASAAATPAPAAAGRGGRAARTPANADTAAPIRVGDLVEIVLEAGGPPVRGTLLRELGDWVYLRDTNGVVRAYPATRVLAVRKS